MRANATVTIPLLRVPTRAALVSTGIVFVLALSFGGGTRQGFWSDVVVQLSALPLLGWALFRLPNTPLNLPARYAIALLGAVAALPLIQLIPLPSALWTALPGRAGFASAYEAAGMALPWMPISLDPNATWRAFLSLLPVAAIFLAVIAIGSRARRLLVAIVLAVAAVSIVLDILQMIGGPESGLRFYAITNADRAVGFFANANHNAAFLYAAIPFAVAGLTALAQDRRRLLGVAALGVLLAGLVMALALTRSRAGMALGVMAGLFGIALVWQFGQGQARRKFLMIVGGGALVAALIVFQFGFVSLSQRVEDSNVSKDLRWTIAAVTSRAALANLPFGSGVGTFIPEYGMFAPRESITIKYVNRAHDDWLEAALEGGVLAMAVAAAFLVWFGWMSLRAWRGGPSAAHGLDGLLPRAASIAVFLLLLHSIVDYPLRTTAITAIFALCCALLVPAGHKNGRGSAMPDVEARPKRAPTQ